MSKTFPYEHLALITDLDGTLLLPDKTLSPADAAAIADFRAKGGKFSFATGRGIQASHPYFDILKPDFPVILYNGGMLYDTKTEQIVFQSLLPACAEDLILKLMHDFSDAGAELLNFDGVYVVQDGEYERKHLAITHLTPNFCDIASIPVTSCCKSLFAASKETIDEMLKTALLPAYAGVSVTRSHDWFLEILPPNVTKGSALTRLRGLLPDGTKLLATGDFNNDIEMLQNADFAGCPADAQAVVQAAVRAAGGYISPKTCENGFYADWTYAAMQHLTAAE